MFFIRKAELVELNAKGEGGYSFGTTFLQALPVETEEDKESFFEDCLKAIIDSGIKGDHWAVTNHLLVITGSCFRLADEYELEEAQTYLSNEYRELEVVDESLDTYYKIYYPLSNEAKKTMQ